MDPNVERLCHHGYIEVAKGRYVHVLIGPTGRLWTVCLVRETTVTEHALLAWLENNEGWSDYVAAELIN